MDDESLLRYSRNIFLADIGVEGQQRWQNSHVVIVGAGGLGGVLSLQCAGLGIGTLTVVDPDVLELHNLNRQLIYKTAQVGEAKASLCARAIAELNPQIKVRGLQESFSQSHITLASSVSLIVDCTDNFETRQAINKVAVDNEVALLSVAVIGYDGQIALFSPQSRHSDGCYACLFGDAFEGSENCSDSGVLGAMASWVASAACIGLARYLAGLESQGYLRLLDGKNMQIRSLELQRDDACPICCGEAH